MKQMSLHLSPELFEQGISLACDRDVTFDQLLHALLAEEAARNPATVLRAQVGADFEAADGWADLQNRLRHKGYALHPAGRSVAVHQYPDGTYLCRIDDLNVSYDQLVARYRAAFPGHRLSWVSARHTQENTPSVAPDVSNASRRLCLTSFFASRRRRGSPESDGRFQP